MNFLITVSRDTLRGAISTAFGTLLTEAKKSPEKFISDKELAAMTPQQYGDRMADEILAGIGLPPPA